MAPRSSPTLVFRFRPRRRSKARVFTANIAKKRLRVRVWSRATRVPRWIFLPFHVPFSYSLFRSPCPSLVLPASLPNDCSRGTEKANVPRGLVGRLEFDSGLRRVVESYSTRRRFRSYVFSCCMMALGVYGRTGMRLGFHEVF